MLVCLLLYAYGVGGGRAARALGPATALGPASPLGARRARTGARRSDCRTLPLEAFKDVLVQGVRLAGEAGLVRLGTVATDGPKRQGNASRHTARRYGSMSPAVERLREAIEALVTQA